MPLDGADLLFDDVGGLPGLTDWRTRLASKIDWWRQRLRYVERPRATIDFEGRSELSVRDVGGWLYSRHPSTQATHLAYRLPGCEVVGRWRMAYPSLGLEETPAPTDLFAFILAGGEVEAHNAFFERCIWTNIMVPRHGWPEVDPSQWRCSAAKASAASLPRALEDACEAMDLPVRKDMEGNRAMKKLARPRKPKKAEVKAWAEAHALEDEIPPMPLLFHETVEEVERVAEYNVADVIAEEALSLATPELSEKELRVWQLDQEMNWRGTMIDLDLARCALAVADRWKRRLNRELERITGVAKGTQRQKVKEWLKEHEGLDLPDTAAPTLDKFIARDGVSARARRVLDIVRQVNRTSTRKYEAMLRRTDPVDWRARDLLMYHGAGTGRWSGKGIQVQNFPRGTAKNAWKTKDGKQVFDEEGRPVAYFDMDRAAADIKDCVPDGRLTGKALDRAWDDNLDWLEATCGDVMELLSSALRGALIASPGMDLLVADYAAIEARCVLWLAGATKALLVFTTGGDIYCDMAEGIYGYPVNKKDHPEERQFGKQAILGLGYGMGFVTFLLTCRKYGIHFTEAQVRKILGDRYLKYSRWVHAYLFPRRRDGETVKEYNARTRQARQVRRRLEDADERPAEIIHELALMKYTVDVYRDRYPEVKQLWKDQEEAAIAATRAWEQAVKAERDLAKLEWDLENDAGWTDWIGSPAWMEIHSTAWRDRIDGPTVEAGKFSWRVVGGFLCCALPSGRVLRYRDPALKAERTSWGEVRESLRYMSVGLTKQWERTATYGGKIVENETQATARDVMVDAELRGVEEGAPYRFLITVHDELVSEAPENEGSVEDYERLLSQTDDWLAGCPIAAEAKRYKRYRK